MDDRAILELLRLSLALLSPLLVSAIFSLAYTWLSVIMYHLGNAPYSAQFPACLSSIMLSAGICLFFQKLCRQIRRRPITVTVTVITKHSNREASSVKG